MAPKLSIPVQAVARVTNLPELVQRFHQLFNPDAGYFSPGDPIAPMTAEPQPRQTQIQVGANLTLTPRSGDSSGALLPFDQLRFFARNYHGVALAVRTRIRQMQGLAWDVTLRDADDADAKPDPKRVKEAKKLLERPDHDNDWQTWLGMVLRDTLEIDAAAIYIEQTRGGGIYALRPIDGSTIKPLIDPRGLVPDPPAPGYQQILWGRPSGMWTKDQLLYRPRNKRTDSMYGQSETEDVLLSVNLALRKLQMDIAHFTDGNIPAGLLGVPQEWTAEQIATYQQFFDSFMAGNLQARSRLIMAPGGRSGQVGVHEFAQFSGEPDFDLFLLKLAWAAFGTNAAEMGFTDDVNRASSDGQQDANARNGVKPLAQWVTSLVNDALDRGGYPELGLKFTTLEAEDELAKAQVHQAYFGIGALDSDEIRQDLGKNPRGKPFIAGSINPLMVDDIGKIPAGMEMGPDGKPRPPVNPNDPTDERLPKKADDADTRDNDDADDDGDPPTDGGGGHSFTVGDGANFSFGDAEKAVPESAKATQAEVEYTDDAPSQVHALGRDRQCRDCRYFDGRRSCVLVQGAISAGGWCVWWEGHDGGAGTNPTPPHTGGPEAEHPDSPAEAQLAYSRYRNKDRHHSLAEGTQLAATEEASKALDDLKTRYHLARDEVRARRTVVLKALASDRPARSFAYRSVEAPLATLIEKGLDRLDEVASPDRPSEARLVFEKAIGWLNAREQAERRQIEASRPFAPAEVHESAPICIEHDGAASLAKHLGFASAFEGFLAVNLPAPATLEKAAAPAPAPQPAPAPPAHGGSSGAPQNGQNGHWVTIHHHHVFIDSQGNFHFGGPSAPGLDPHSANFHQQVLAHLQAHGPFVRTKIPTLTNGHTLTHALVSGQNGVHVNMHLVGGGWRLELRDAGNNLLGTKRVASMKTAAGQAAAEEMLAAHHAHKLAVASQAHVTSLANSVAIANANRAASTPTSAQLSSYFAGLQPTTIRANNYTLLNPKTGDQVVYRSLGSGWTLQLHDTKGNAVGPLHRIPSKGGQGTHYVRQVAAMMLYAHEHGTSNVTLPSTLATGTQAQQVAAAHAHAGLAGAAAPSAPAAAPAAAPAPQPAAAPPGFQTLSAATLSTLAPTRPRGWMWNSAVGVNNPAVLLGPNGMRIVEKKGLGTTHFDLEDMQGNRLASHTFVPGSGTEMMAMARMAQWYETQQSAAALQVVTSSPNQSNTTTSAPSTPPGAAVNIASWAGQLPAGWSANIGHQVNGQDVLYQHTSGWTVTHSHATNALLLNSPGGNVIAHAPNVAYDPTNPLGTTTQAAMRSARQFVNATSSVHQQGLNQNAPAAAPSSLASNGATPQQSLTHNQLIAAVPSGFQAVNGPTTAPAGWGQPFQGVNGSLQQGATGYSTFINRVGNVHHVELLDGANRLIASHDTNRLLTPTEKDDYAAKMAHWAMANVHAVSAAAPAPAPAATAAPKTPLKPATVTTTHLKGQNAWRPPPGATLGYGPSQHNPNAFAFTSVTGPNGTLHLSVAHPGLASSHVVQVHDASGTLVGQHVHRGRLRASLRASLYKMANYVHAGGGALPATARLARAKPTNQIVTPATPNLPPDGQTGGGGTYTPPEPKLPHLTPFLSWRHGGNQGAVAPSWSPTIDSNGVSAHTTPASALPAGYVHTDHTATAQSGGNAWGAGDLLHEVVTPSGYKVQARIAPQQLSSQYSTPAPGDYYYALSVHDQQGNKLTDYVQTNGMVARSGTYIQNRAAAVAEWAEATHKSIEAFKNQNGAQPIVQQFAHHYQATAQQKAPPTPKPFDASDAAWGTQATRTQVETHLANEFPAMVGAQQWPGHGGFDPIQHSMRVVDPSNLRTAGLSTRDAELLRIAMTYHDVGKGQPDRAKAGQSPALDPEHPRYSEQMVHGVLWQHGLTPDEHQMVRRVVKWHDAFGVAAQNGMGQKEVEHLADLSHNDKRAADLLARAWQSDIGTIPDLHKYAATSDADGARYLKLVHDEIDRRAQAGLAAPADDVPKMSRPAAVTTHAAGAPNLHPAGVKYGELVQKTDSFHIGPGTPFGSIQKAPKEVYDEAKAHPDLNFAHAFNMAYDGATGHVLTVFRGIPASEVDEVHQHGFHPKNRGNVHGQGVYSIAGGAHRQRRGYGTSHQAIIEYHVGRAIDEHDLTKPGGVHDQWVAAHPNEARMLGSSNRYGSEKGWSAAALWGGYHAITSEYNNQPMVVMLDPARMRLKTIVDSNTGKGVTAHNKDGTTVQHRDLTGDERNGTGDADVPLKSGNKPNLWSGPARTK